MGEWRGARGLGCDPHEVGQGNFDSGQSVTLTSTKNNDGSHTHTYPEKFQSVLSFSVYLCDVVTPTRGCELIACKFPARNEENFRACFLFWHLSPFSPRIFSIFVARFCLRIFKILYHRVFVFLPPLINSLPWFVHPSSVFFCFC